MAEDILDDLDKDFDTEMEDFLGEPSIDESDGSDSYDLDQDAFDEDVDDDDAPSKKGSSKENVLTKIMGKISGISKFKKILILIIGLVVLLLAIAVGIWIFVFGGADKTDQDIAVAEQATIEENINPVEEIIFEDIVALEPFERMHLKTSSTMGLISLTLSLELTDHRYRKQMIAMEDRIRQIVITQVAEMTWMELRNPEGKIRLKYDLLKRFNSLFPKATVRNVFFTYFIMQ